MDKIDYKKELDVLKYEVDCMNNYLVDRNEGKCPCCGVNIYKKDKHSPHCGWVEYVKMFEDKDV